MAHLIPIGNSLGVRIPKAIIEQVGFNEDINLTFTVTNEGLLISPEKQARKGWEEMFKPSKEKPLMDEIANEFDEHEWKW